MHWLGLLLQSHISKVSRNLRWHPKLAWAQGFLFGAGALLPALFPIVLSAVVGLGLVTVGLLMFGLRRDSSPSAEQPTSSQSQETLEDLIARGEVLPTSHPRIFRVRDDGAAHNPDLLRDIDELIELAVAGREAETEAKLWQIVRGERRGSGDEHK